MGTAIVMGSLGVAGCLGFLALGWARRSRYALGLGLAFGVLAALIAVIVAFGYVDCTQRHDCPAGLGVVKVAYFGLLVALVLLLLGGLAVLFKLPSAREGGLEPDVALTARMVVVVILLGLLYLFLAFWFVAFVVAAISQRSWVGLALVVAFGAAPLVVVAWQAAHAERLALRATEARVLAPGQEPALQTLVSRLALAADLPVPRVAVAPSSEANAFSIGLTPDRAAIVVTTELLRRLNEGELKAVIAHELAHIANRDGAVMSLVAAPAMVGSLLFRIRGGFLIFLLYVPVWLVGLLLLWAMSRAREFYADRGSARITGAPEQLMAALAKLSGKAATRDLRGVATRALCIVRPGRRRWYDPDFSHPSVEKRIARLETLARQLAR